MNTSMNSAVTKILIIPLVYEHDKVMSRQVGQVKKIIVYNSKLFMFIYHRKIFAKYLNQKIENHII